jgi:hypothetical protein
MRNRRSVTLILAVLLVLAGSNRALAPPPPPGPPPVWVAQGPEEIIGQDEGIQNKPVAGAINAIVAHPINPDVLFVGTVNGGVWKTSNATCPNPTNPACDATGPTPTWIPLTDQQLPALSINSLAVSPVTGRLFAGTGSTSSFAFNGSPGFGVARSTDGGGETWEVLAANNFFDSAINSIVPTRLFNGNLVLAASLCFPLPPVCAADSDFVGVYRSTTNGASFERISGNGSSGLPDAGVSKLVADPLNVERFYAGVPQSYGFNGAQPGVYRSDGGSMWTPVNTGLEGLDNSLRILLSVHSDTSNHVVYAAVIANDGTLSGVFRSTNQGQGDSWTNLGVLPSPPIYPGGQGLIHGALAADPSNPNVVFIAGDRQQDKCEANPTPDTCNPDGSGKFPNANGCNDYSANVFRGDASRLPGNIWETVVCKGANGTSPHADARDMVFDANGDLLLANDGGIFRLVSPNTDTRQWVAVVGDIQPTEFHSVAYDPVGKVVFGGAQDTGTPYQEGPFWFDFTGGDGGVVAVDTESDPGNTVRYTSSAYFGCHPCGTDPMTGKPIGDFVRTSCVEGVFCRQSIPVKLDIISGDGTGQNLYQFDLHNIQIYNAYVLNAINPSRMLIGTRNIYESTTQGDMLNNLSSTGDFIVGASSIGQPLAYGGCIGGRPPRCMNGTPNEDVFYVGAGKRESVLELSKGKIYHRVSMGVPMMTLDAYPGTAVRTIVMNPQNYRQVFVVDDRNAVWGSFDEGASWINLTANLPSLTSQVATIEVFSPDNTIKNTVLIAGGFGAFQLRRPGAAGGSWTRLSSGIPNALVLDLHYDYVDDVLVAGTLGRGAWTLTKFFRGDAGTGLIAKSTAAPRQGGSGDIIPQPNLRPIRPSAFLPIAPDSP